MAFNTAFQPVLDGINALKAEVASTASLQAELTAAQAQIAAAAQDDADTVAELTAALPAAAPVASAPAE